MRCVETRSRHAKSGASGLRVATMVAGRELAARLLPPVELAAYMARHYDSLEARAVLVLEVEQILTVTAKSQKWSFRQRSDKPPIQTLADLIVDQWLSPSKYWREKEVSGQTINTPIVSSLALAMGVNNKTWHVYWKGRFNQFNGLPEIWYQRGEQLLAD